MKYILYFVLFFFFCFFQSNISFASRHTKCQTCKGTGRCPECDGTGNKGYWINTDRPRERYDGDDDGSGTPFGKDNDGWTIYHRQYIWLKPREIKKNCNCRGTGKCASCKGDGYWDADDNFENMLSLSVNYISFKDSINLPTPYQIGLCLNFTSCFNKHLAWDCNFGWNFGLETNRKWISNAYNKNISDFSNIGYGGSCLYLSIGLIPILINKPAIAFGIGPEIGYSNIYFPRVDMNNGSDFYDFKDGEFYGMYGYKAYLFLGGTFFLTFEYTNGFSNYSIQSRINSNVIKTIPFNYEQYRIGIGIKASDFLN